MSITNKTRTDLTTLKIQISKGNMPNSPNSWKHDGFDHINIGPRSTTKLGRILDFDHIRRFEHPKLGRFSTILGLWHYIAAKEPDEAYRDLVAGSLRKYRHENKAKPVNVPNLRAILMHSAYLKIKASRSDTKELVESTLPFDCYRVLDSGLRERLSFSIWTAGGYEVIREALRNNTDPDFSYLLDEPGDMYEPLLKRILPEYTASTELAADIAGSMKTSVRNEGGRQFHNRPIHADVVDIDSDRFHIQPVAVQNATNEPVDEGQPEIEFHEPVEAEQMEVENLDVQELAARLETVLLRDAGPAMAAVAEIAEDFIDEIRDDRTSVFSDAATDRIQPKNGDVVAISNLPNGKPVMTVIVGEEAEALRAHVQEQPEEAKDEINDRLRAIREAVQGDN